MKVFVFELSEILVKIATQEDQAKREYEAAKAIATKANLECERAKARLDALTSAANLIEQAKDTHDTEWEPIPM